MRTTSPSQRTRLRRVSLAVAFATVLATPLLALGTHAPRAAGTVTGTAEGFYEYLPEGYDASPGAATWPILFFFHGVGERGNGSLVDLEKLLRTGIPRLIDRAEWPPTPPGDAQEADRFIILSLQDASGFPSRQRVNDFIDFALGPDGYNADSERVYLTGLSAGGITIWNYLGNHYAAGLPDKVAAVMPIAGDGRNQIARACLFAHIPAWAFHGDADTTVVPAGSIESVAAMDACSPAPTDARVTIFPGLGHTGWNQVWDLSRMGTEDPMFDSFDASVFDWLLDYTRGGMPTDLLFSDGFESGDATAWSAGQ